jgi:class I fructose-bisphosphate aldolase
MQITEEVKKILGYYESDNPGTKRNLCHILMHGKLGGSGKLVILPVDQGFEHGPVRSFAINEDAYDPHYHFKLAIKAGLSAYAAPLGMLEAGADSFAGAVPLILKMNSSNLLAFSAMEPYQAVTSSVQDALRLGCSAIGFTIYPGSGQASTMMAELKELSKEAKSHGLVVVVWSYPRGGDLNKVDETAVDVCAYAAHMAALLGAHIIKVKPPKNAVSNKDNRLIYERCGASFDKLSDRIKHVVQACFAGRRLVVFSGGESKAEDDILAEIRAIKEGGGSGSIIGRNSFQRPLKEAVSLLGKIVDIYLK